MNFNKLTVCTCAIFFLLLSALTCAQQPIELVTPYGTTTLTQAPKRILALEYSFIDSLLELGVTPIAIAQGEVGEGFLPPYLAESMADLPNVGTRHQPSLEKILALKPDVIIADPLFNANIKTQLEKIAPTIMLDGITATPQMQMQAIELFGKMLNKENQAQQIITKLSQQYNDLRTKNNHNHKTVLIGYISEAGLFRSLTANAMSTQILADFGYKNIIAAVNERQSTPITLESVFVKNPDVIIILLTDGNDQGYKALQKSSLWSQLTAVKQGKVFFFDRDIWARSHGVIALRQKMDDLVNANLINM
jgi:ABC-type Fe3+-citrate transport system substrate-binding protein